MIGINSVYLSNGFCFFFQLWQPEKYLASQGNYGYWHTIICLFLPSFRVPWLAWLYHLCWFWVATQHSDWQITHLDTSTKNNSFVNNKKWSSCHDLILKAIKRNKVVTWGPIYEGKAAVCVCSKIKFQCPLMLRRKKYKWLTCTKVYKFPQNLQPFQLSLSKNSWWEFFL